MPRTSDRRTMILDAVLAIIADGGVDAVRARRVAAEAGVHLGSVSYWFKSRDALIREAFDHFLEKNTAFLTGLLERRALSTVTDLVDFLCDMVATEFRDPSHVLTEYELVLAAGRDPELAAAFAVWERTLLDGVMTVMQTIASPSPAADARTLVEMVRGFEILAVTRPAPDITDLRERLHRLLRALTTPNP